MRIFPLVAGLAAVLWQSPVDATEFTDKTPCRIAGSVIEHWNVDRGRDLANYIRAKFRELDQIHIKKGEDGVIVTLSDGGMVSMIAAVAVRCESYPRQTIYNVTSFVYREMRRAEMGLGVAR